MAIIYHDGKQGSLINIEKGKLKIPVEYQRGYNPLKSRQIRANWSWEACGALLVMDREGTLFVVDGQHRFRAALLIDSIKTLPCIVFKSGSIQQEAKAFIECNTSRKMVSALEKHKALCIAGDDLAEFVGSVLEKHGLELTRTVYKTGQVKCIAWLMRCAKESKDVFEQTVDLAAEISVKEAVSVNILYGIEYLIKKGLDVQDKRIRERFASRGSELINAAIRKRVAIEGHTGGEICGKAILRDLNHGLRIKIVLKGVNEE